MKRPRVQLIGPPQESLDLKQERQRISDARWLGFAWGLVAGLVAAMVVLDCAGRLR